ncbi:hypothetical protein HHK36_023993 [Tetracentron sinense]|uniref:Cellulose synthase n=1 Tax=Tetracentron sinense TaxID=13715 RepID=A0A835D971_TETSI|nr:hypothetical protein HHK36_023993 [Tetracentron sinense]
MIQDDTRGCFALSPPKVANSARNRDFFDKILKDEQEKEPERGKGKASDQANAASKKSSDGDTLCTHTRNPRGNKTELPPKCGGNGTRVSHVPTEGEDGRWAWIGLFGAELWFILYWLVTQSIRYEKELPGVDIFVCTADPTIEPPIMVINTVLSVMAYDYPPEKLSVYLSDDGCSDLTFFALLEASRFSKQWLPFCKNFQVEPRSPAAYFSTASKPLDPIQANEWTSIKKLYEEMKNRIESATTLGRISEEIRREHKGFLEWDSGSTRRDHKTILQILIDGRDPKALDIEGQPLPTLVYLAREKRPQYHHNFKAGAMNALIRVSSKISNGQIILNVDCDMYSNNSQSVRDALCFFMDEENGHEIAYVQYPQNFDNVTKNDIYSNSLRVFFEVELHGMDGNGGPCYTGTGCFHRRESLCGSKFSKKCKGEWRKANDWKISGPWFPPFAYVIIAKYGYSFGEFIWSGGTPQGWWHDQRIWMFRRTTSYLFGFINTILKQLGFAKSTFVVTAKVVEDDVSQRYEQEIMEFGTTSPMFTILATLAFLNLFSLIAVVKRVVMGTKISVFEPLALQIIQCGLLVIINLPIYQGIFYRKDKGCMPHSLAVKTVILALLACILSYEKELPGVDIFVCTADPTIEPPIMVINTVLSVMAYDYPPEKLSVYLSDDGCSDLTFFALLEASHFSKQWLPFCKKFQVEPRSPAAYFSTTSKPLDPIQANEWASIKKLYEGMKNRIESTTTLGRISEEIRREHKGYLEWDSGSTRHDHKTILQILIDGRDPKAMDIEGQTLPNLVYLAREKRPQYHHNYKAGAMNALLRVSSKMSNGQIILNVDCDMYSNNSQSVRDALCFFMDEEKGHEIAYVQYPQTFDNVTKNDIYSGSLRVGRILIDSAHSFGMFGDEAGASRFG